jgi:phospholipase D1/2
VDDRLAIIGSANINERSQKGDRDSEIAVVVRDTDMINSTMAGKPFQVGRFSHTLRVRLMREHVGIDVDAIDAEEMARAEPTKSVQDQRANGPVLSSNRDQPGSNGTETPRAIASLAENAGMCYSYLSRAP